MHPDIYAYMDDLRKRREEEEFSMFLDCVVMPNIDNDEILKRLGAHLTITVEKG